MRNDHVEQFTVENLTVTIDHDDDPESPRAWDNFGTMICWHRNYRLGDHKLNQWDSPTEFYESDEYKQAAIILPLGLYDHSGITMYVGSQPSPFDPGGWDSGQVGYIYVSKADVLKEYSRKHLSKQLLAKVTKVLTQEVETYDQYLTGDVYGYTIEDADGNNVDSCWGFYGLDYAVQEAKSAAEYAIKREGEEVKKIAQVMAL